LTHLPLTGIPLVLFRKLVVGRNERFFCVMHAPPFFLSSVLVISTLACQLGVSTRCALFPLIPLSLRGTLPLTDATFFLGLPFFFFFFHLIVDFPDFHAGHAVPVCVATFPPAAFPGPLTFGPIDEIMG